MRTALLSLFALILVLSVAAEFILDLHPESWWQRIPAFFAVFGFLGCVLITVVAKAIGTIWLQKREDYYD